MKKRLIYPFIVMLVIFVAGCGESPRTVFHRAVVLRNELADTMRQAHDEDSAQQLIESKIVRLEAKWETLEHIAKEVFEKLEGKEKAAAARAFIPYLDEHLETELRLKQELTRLSKLQQQSAEAGIGGNKIQELASKVSKFQVSNLWNENPFVGPGVGVGGRGGFGGPRGFPPAGPPGGGMAPPEAP